MQEDSVRHHPRHRPRAPGSESPIHADAEARSRCGPVWGPTRLLGRGGAADRTLGAWSISLDLYSFRGAYALWVLRGWESARAVYTRWPVAVNSGFADLSPICLVAGGHVVPTSGRGEPSAGVGFPRAALAPEKRWIPLGLLGKEAPRGGATDWSTIPTTISTTFSVALVAVSSWGSRSMKASALVW